MDDAASTAQPREPVFGVEVIDADGYAWLYPGLHLHEALKISAYFEREALPGKEPRIYVPAALAGAGLTEE
jgi:hypothetical protein